MATFKLNKKIKDIQEPQLLPEDWYTVRVVREPTQVPNNKKKQGKTVEDGGGDNLLISMRVQSQNPEHNGRPFLVSLPFPDPKEEEMFDERSGMSIYDVKAERIGRWAAAFSGKDYEDLSEEDEVNLDAGDEAQIYIGQSEDWRENSEEFINNIDIFNTVPRPV